MTRRKSCKQPATEPCTAKARGRCFRCSPRTPEEKARNAAATKANWKDPAFRARHAAAVKANWKDPEFRARNAAAVKAMLEERWQDPEFRAKQSAAVKANWQDPEFRARKAAATKAASAVWPDCPDELRDDYETLRHYMSARDARAALDPEYRT